MTADNDCTCKIDFTGVPSSATSASPGTTPATAAADPAGTADTTTAPPASTASVTPRAARRGNGPSFAGRPAGTCPAADIARTSTSSRIVTLALRMSLLSA
jgi:hypothetical protein